MKPLKDKLESYGLSTPEVIDLTEAVNALNNYEDLPQATKDSMQAICDRNKVYLIYNEKRGSLFITGIGTKMRVTYLFPEDGTDESQKLLKNSTEYYLFPNADNELIKTEDI